MKQKTWKLKRIFHVMTKQEGLGQFSGAVEAWSTNAIGCAQAEYDRLCAKFTKAMRFASEYEWSQKKCVAFGVRIEAGIVENCIVEAEQAVVAMNKVMQEVKAQKLLQKLLEVLFSNPNNLTS